MFRKTDPSLKNNSRREIFIHVISEAEEIHYTVSESRTLTSKQPHEQLRFWFRSGRDTLFHKAEPHFYNNKKDAFEHFLKGEQRTETFILVLKAEPHL